MRIILETYLRGAGLLAVILMAWIPMPVDAGLHKHPVNPGAQQWELSVRVLNEQGRPVSSASVAMAMIDVSRVFAEASSATDGRALVRVPTMKPTDMLPLRLMLVVDATGHMPTVVTLRGSPDREVVVRLGRAYSGSWVREVASVAREYGAGVVNLVVPAMRGHFSVPVTLPFTGDPCDVVPGGVTMCRSTRSSCISRPALAINGRVVTGEFRGRSVEEAVKCSM